MTSAAWIGIDLGTQSVRALALSADGTTLAVEAEPLTSRREGDRHEQDPEQWWSATVAVLQRLTAALPAGVVPRGLAVSGTSGTIVRLARDGTSRGPAVMYDDRRAAPLLPRVTAATAGLAARLGYRVQATWALPKIVSWFDDRTVAAGEVVGHQPDVVTGRLAGRRLPSDLSSALKSGVDLDDATWPDAVLAALDVPVEALNGVVASGTVIGEVGAAAAAQTGLPAGCAIVAGMTDGCAAQIAAGALAPGSWNSVLGTTLVLKGAARERRPDGTGAIYAHRAPFDGGWFPGGASSTGARAVRHWLPGRDLARLSAAVDPQVTPAAYPLVGTGERFPFVADRAEGFFPATVDSSDDVAVLGAILSGVAWVERLAFDLVDLTGYDHAGPVLLTGGGARNPVWNQLRADVLGRALQLPGQHEGAAGMAVLAAAGVGRAEDPALINPLGAVAAELLPEPRRIDADLDRHARLMTGYRAFLEALDARGWLDPVLLNHAHERITG